MKGDERARGRAEGRAWFGGLTPREKWEVGDELVLDTWDWRNWLDEKPPVGFRAGVCEASDAWEMEDARRG